MSEYYAPYAPETCSEDGHLQGRCPCRAGGDPVLAPTSLYANELLPQCWLCGRSIRLGIDEWQVVTVDPISSALICGVCFERGEEGIEVPLSYEEEDGHEGDPAWNGAFG